MKPKLKDLLKESILGDLPSSKMFKYNKETGKFDAPGKNLKEDFVDDEDDMADIYYTADGWNEDALTDDFGLGHWLDKAQRVQYEIDKARRGTYGVKGKTFKDLINTLDELKEELADMVERMDDLFG